MKTEFNIYLNLIYLNMVSNILLFNYSYNIFNIFCLKIKNKK